MIKPVPVLQIKQLFNLALVAYFMLLGLQAHATPEQSIEEQLEGTPLEALLHQNDGDNETVQAPITKNLTAQRSDIPSKAPGVTATPSEKGSTKAASASGTAAKTIKKTASDKLAKLSVLGVSKEVKKNIELSLPKNKPACNASREDVKNYFKVIKRYMRTAARSLGYYDAKFTTGGRQKDGCWQLTLKVNEGPAVRVVRQNIKVLGPAKNERLIKAVMEKLPYKRGERFNHQKYTQFKTALAEAAQATGYFDAKFTQHRVLVNPLKRSAQIDLVMDSGQRVRYGEVTIEQSILSDELARRFLNIHPGKPYSSKDLIEQQQALQKSGYFSAIEIQADPKKISDGRIPVNIKMTPVKRNLHSYQVGFGTDTGPRAKVEMTRRYTGKNGGKLKLLGQVSKVLSGISARYELPKAKPDEDSLTYTFDALRERTDDIWSSSVEFGLDYKNKLDNRWWQTAFIRTLIDRTEESGGSTEDSYLTLVGAQWQRVHTQEKARPRNGWRANIKAQGAVDGLLSDKTAFQVTSKLKGIHSIGKTRLLARLDLGYTHSDDVSTLPKKLRFFAGGSNSVRGFAYESIGDVEGSTTVGGTRLVAGSLEIEQPVTDDFAIAAFVDAGQASKSILEDDFSVGYGGGVRWFSPIGPVRVDLATQHGESGSLRLHIGVGADL